ncbi:MAG: HEPN domain-containing protein [Tepidisphaeraceae bacterium]|jgi:uncharacterized protein (UPF0332 family)
MTWSEIGKNNLQAAKLNLAGQPRSAASRAYYAAHVVLAEKLVANGCPLSPGRQTPAHAAQASLIGRHLAHEGTKVVRELRAVIRRLYARRIDADYKRNVTMDRLLAMESIRDASTLFQLLKVS